MSAYTFDKILWGILEISCIYGFLCCIALLILLFLIQTISRTHGKLDKEGESPQDAAGTASNEAKQDDPDGSVHHPGSSDIIGNTGSRPYYVQAALDDIYAASKKTGHGSGRKGFAHSGGASHDSDMGLNIFKKQ